MKKIYLFIVAIAFVFTGCEDQLELQPFQEIGPDVVLGTQENILNLLIGSYDEAGQVATFGGRTHMMADLYGATGEVSWNGTFLDPRQIFQKQIFIDNGFVGAHWVNSYTVINQVNLVIDNLAIIEDAGVRSTTEGEAKFLRAISYFDLIRLFAAQYQTGGGNNQPGVPLRLSGITDFGADLSIERSTVEEVYTQIINDLNDAVNLLPASNGEFADQYAARALLARVYFQQGNYAAARDAANDVLTNSGHSLASTFAGAFNNDVDGVEDIFTFQVTSQTGANGLITFYADQGNGGRGGDIGLEAPYFALFDDAANDARASFTYVSPQNGETLTSKYTNQFGNVPTLRIGEMHLIRAESNFREGTTVGLTPLAEINALRGRSGAAALGAVTLDIFFNERRLELAFEGHLIHDYKRTGRAVGALPANDNSLVFPIPQGELDTNPLITQNPGYSN